jgi:hypothetical protein
MTTCDEALFMSARMLGAALWRLRTELSLADPPIPLNRAESFSEALKIAHDANEHWKKVQDRPDVLPLFNLLAK